MADMTFIGGDDRAVAPGKPSPPKSADRQAAPLPPRAPAVPEGMAFGISRHDGALPADLHRSVREFLEQPSWQFGWKSDAKRDPFSFWHKHFAGPIETDREIPDSLLDQGGADCAPELSERAPVLYQAWEHLMAGPLTGHRLVRCYANAIAYGSEGTLHVDSRSPRSHTCIYYANARWMADWGGETLFFSPDRRDILSAVLPQPNRIVLFNGVIPHLARGVSRAYPGLRVTLMFKTERTE